jgi:hypothetical protein
VRRSRIVVLVVAAVAAGVAIYFAVVVWPWVAAPDASRVADEWAFVERTANASAPAPAADARFDAFVAATTAARRDLTDLANQPNAAHTEGALPDSVRAALEALAAWSAGAATDTAPPSCAQPKLDAVAVVRLAQIALTTPPVEPRAPALTKLSERMRRRGSYFEYVVGMKILERLLARAALNPEPLAPYLRDTKPDGAELLAAVARDDVCTDALFEGATSASIESTTYEAEGAPWLARHLVRPARERAMVRLYRGERLHAASEVAGDPAALAARLAPDQARPPSIGVSITSIATYEGAVPVIAQWKRLAERR